MASESFPWVVLLAPAFRWVFQGINAQSKEPDRRRRDLEEHLLDAENYLLAGNATEAAASLEKAAPLLERVPGSTAAGQSARLHLCEGLVAKLEGQFADAETSFSNVLQLVDSIENPQLGANLRGRAEIESVRLADDADQFRERAGRTLALEPGIDDPVTLARMAWLALDLGRIEQSAGKWERARHLWQETVRIGERLATPASSSAQSGWAREREVGTWADGRAAAARACMEFAEALFSVDDHEGGQGWLDRADHVLEGPEHAITLEFRAKLLLIRARWMRDSLTATVTEESVLRRAVSAGEAAGTPGGVWAAAEAESLLGQAYMRSGDAGRAIQSFGSAIERVEALDQPMARLMTIQTLVLLADAHTANEAWAPAAAALRRALERSRDAVEPECRDRVVEVTHRLHACLLEQEALVAGRELVQTLANLVPGLSPSVRSAGTIVQAHLLGLQLAAESRPGEADQSFARVEAMARESDSPAARYWERQAGFQRGMLALQQRQPVEARGHLERALAIPVATVTPAEEIAERAGIQLRLAECEMALDRHEAAERLLRRSAADGVASGRADGRFIAAIASWMSAGFPEREVEQRRRLLDAAARLGRLSGTQRGRDLARKAEEDRKELGL